MTLSFDIPSAVTLAKWRNGSPLTDDELAVLQTFYAAMVQCTDALGDRFVFVNMGLRMEHRHLLRLAEYRDDPEK